jgi:formiminotetrahydrofolate cyclodeaminase
VAYLDMPLGAFLGALAAAEPAPSGGGAAAVAVALGASLCAMTARLSARQLTRDQASELTIEAERLAARSASLIKADADSYQRVLAERRKPAGAAPPAESSPPRSAAAGRQRRISTALSDAAAVPMEIIELAGQVVRLAARLAADGNPSLRGDAITAAELAAGGARAAAVLVGINLAGAPADDRHARAEHILSRITRSLRAAPRR